MTRHNFRSKLEEVEEAIESCSFLSIDGEFTGGTKNNQKLGTGKQYGETRMFIPDPGWIQRHKVSGSSTKNFTTFFPKKDVTKLSEIGSRMNIPRSRIRIFPIPDPGV